MSSGGVQVAVRVRPFNQREIDLGCKLCVDMEGKRTTLFDPDDKDKKRDFYFDYSFWSHDGFTTTSSGYNEPDGPRSKYADQKLVYNVLGKSILDNAWQGYHCSLFAYGQTGSGKSYSVMGYSTNKGVVPIACEEIFNRIDSERGDTDKKFEVLFGMMEIYNEKLQDLLIDPKNRPPQGMKIRESASLGFFAEGLKKVPVRNFQEIEARMDEGTGHRSVAATQMNATSSRAHTIILIEFKQIFTANGQKMEKLSVMNLVDLAGSEKVGKTGATGDRLKEAANINKSLSMLGNVISALAEIEGGKSEKKVPYRDSTLTKLLKNALGGNSKTIMICAISPANDNYEESLSTLRYADQAKKIQNKAMVNESATDKLIRELKNENQRIKNMIDKITNLIDKNTDPKDPEFIKLSQELAQLLENKEANELYMRENDKTEDERLREIEEEEKFQKKVDVSRPHLTNLNEDPQINKKVKYSLNEAEVRVGKKKPDSEPDIILNGLGIKPQHCVFINDGEKIFISVEGRDDIKEFVHINGQILVENQKELKHNDRIILGTQQAFLVKIPGYQPREGTPANEDQLDWEFAQREILNEFEKKNKDQMDQLHKNLSQNMESKIEEMEKSYAKEIQELEQQKIEVTSLYEIRVAQVAADLKAGRKVDTEMNSKMMKEKFLNAMNKLKKKQTQVGEKIQDEQKLLKEAGDKEKNELKKLEEEIATLVPKLNEMNLIADELGRNVKFVLKMSDQEQGKVCVQVQNKENGSNYTWDLEKALNRYYCLRDQLEDYNNNGELLGEKNNQDDPFWDPPDPSIIGIASIRLGPLGQFLDNPDELWIMEQETNKIKGLLKVNIIPCDSKGENVIINSGFNFQSLPSQNVHRYCKVVILSAQLCKNTQDTYVEYKLNDEYGRTNIIYGKNEQPYYKFEKIHDLGIVSEDQILSIFFKPVGFKVYGITLPDVEDVFLGMKDQDLNIEYGDLIKNKKHLSKLEQLEKKKKQQEEEKAKQNKLGLEKQKTENQKLQGDEDQPLYKKKWFQALILGFISFVILIAFIVICQTYRSSWEQLTYLQELQIVKDLDLNFRQWRAYQVLISSTYVLLFVMLTNSFAAKLMPYQLGNLAKISSIPYVLWAAASLYWILADKGFSSESELELICKDASDKNEQLCSFNDKLKQFSSSILIFLILIAVIFLAYLVVIYKWSILKTIQMDLFKKKQSENQQENMLNQQTVDNLQQNQSQLQFVKQIN